MVRQFVTLLIALVVSGLFTYTVLSTRSVSALPQELTVISRTKGDEVLTAEVVDNEVRIKLKNNHRQTITAFAISFSGMTVREDFAYSEVHFGIEPGDTFQTSYPISPSPAGAELRTLYLLAVLLTDGAKDGDPKVAQQIKDERLGEKVEILRTLKILENDGQSSKDLKLIKTDFVAALDAGESEARIILNELQPASRFDHKLSDELKSGLQVGREKMLQRLAVLEELPPERREQGFTKLKDRLNELLPKL